jgi:HEAT repeat protein
MDSEDVPNELSSLSTAELFAGARIEIAGADPDSPVPYLVALQERPTEEVFNTAVDLLSDDDPAARELGAWVLRELGPYDDAGRRPFTARAVPALVDRLSQESDPRVLGWVISALGYNGAREALQRVLPFADHPFWRVRFHVAAALPSLVDPERIEPDALAVLQQLCRDDDAETRFYALYALVEEVAGVDVEHLSRSITDRLDDPDEQIREFARAQHETRR